MIDKLIDIFFILAGACCLGGVLYAAIHLQNLRAENQINKIQLKDDEIEKEINAEPLDQLVNFNNKSSGSVPDGKT